MTGRGEPNPTLSLGDVEIFGRRAKPSNATGGSQHRNDSIQAVRRAADLILGHAERKLRRQPGEAGPPALFFSRVALPEKTSIGECSSGVNLDYTPRVGRRVIPEERKLKSRQTTQFVEKREGGVSRPGDQLSADVERLLTRHPCNETIGGSAERVRLVFPPREPRRVVS
jgi:hypothetical protein